MSIFNNTLSVHLSDSTVTIYRHGKGIVSWPFCCLSKSPKDEDSTHDSLCRPTYPYRGSVVADFEMCKNLMRSYIRQILPKLHFNTSIHVAISPVAGITEYRAAKDLFSLRWVALYYEPIAFLCGINKQDGIVISINMTMLEISIIQDSQIIRYQWRYVSEEVKKHDWDSVCAIVINFLKNIPPNETLFNQSAYLIGEPYITGQVYYKLTAQNDYKIEVSFDSNRIIVENVHLSQPIKNME